MKKKDIHVIPHNGEWATKSEGASRVGGIHTTQKSAIDSAVTQAKSKKVEVVIHRKNGQIRDSDSYGNDPYPPKDKKH